MSSEKKQKLITGEQGDIFRQLESSPAVIADNAPDLDLVDDLRFTVKQMMRTSKNHYGLSRDALVDRINLCLEEHNHITLRKLNSWSAGSREDHPIPAHILPALCWACHANISPLQLLARALGLHVIDESEHLATQLGQVVADKARAARTERELKTQLGAYNNDR